MSGYLKDNGVWDNYGGPDHLRWGTHRENMADRMERTGYTHHRPQVVNHWGKLPITW